MTRTEKLHSTIYALLCLLTLGLIIVLMTGCSTNYAVYRHPGTGDVLACESGGDAYGPGMYSACKDAIEARGYVRVGTERRAYSAQYGVDYAVPRPLPEK